MNSKEADSEKLMELLGQHWSHARHISKQSATFLSIYFATFVGALAVSRNPEENLLIAIALFGISLAGIFIQIKHGLEFHHHIRLASLISREESIDDWMSRPLGVQTLIYDSQTSWLYSPQHWLVFIHIVGLSSSIGWVFWAMFGPNLALSVSLIALVLTSIIVYLIVRRYLGRIDEAIENRTGKTVY